VSSENANRLQKRRKIMVGDNRKPVSLKDALLSTMFTQDALIKLLIEKRIITEQEVLDKIEAISTQMFEKYKNIN
jgi:hypothetical protein